MCATIKNESIRLANNNKRKIEYNDEIGYINTKFSFDDENIILNCLDEMERRIIIDHVLLDKTFKEISKEINKPLNTVKSIYRRAIIRLEKKL